MANLSKRIVDAAEARDKDYVIWDDELLGFGLRVLASGKPSYLIQHRSAGRSRRYTIGLHGVWTPELARKDGMVQLGRVAQGDNPAEERQLDHKAITVKELCDPYLNDLKAGLILGKGGRPKKATTIVTDTGRIRRHILPLIGTRRVKDLAETSVASLLSRLSVTKAHPIARPVSPYIFENARNTAACSPLRQTHDGSLFEILKFQNAKALGIGISPTLRGASA